MHFLQGITGDLSEKMFPLLFRNCYINVMLAILTPLKMTKLGRKEKRTCFNKKEVTLQTINIPLQVLTGNLDLKTILSLRL